MLICFKQCNQFNQHLKSHFFLPCSLDVTLCEEAVFQSLASLKLPSMPLERLLESLPGRKVDRKSLESLKKACSPHQQVFHLLRLWREQNKDQDKLYRIIQGLDQYRWNCCSPDVSPRLILYCNIVVISAFVSLQVLTTVKRRCPAATAWRTWL